MEPVPIPRLTLKFSIELETDYDPFKGKTKEEFRRYIQDELQEVIYDINPVKNAYTIFISMEDNGTTNPE